MKWVFEILYYIVLVASIYLGLLFLFGGPEADAYGRPKDTMRVFHDEQMGCDYISINGGAFFPRLNSLGIPACDYPEYIKEMFNE